jgi:hypothetical protein
MGSGARPDGEQSGPANVIRDGKLDVHEEHTDRHRHAVEREQLLRRLAVLCGGYLQEEGILSAIAGGGQTSGTFEWQPGPLLGWGNLFFHGDLEDIMKGPQTLNRGFNIDAGFKRDPAKVPAGYQKRVFPTLIDGSRQDKLLLPNASVQFSRPAAPSAAG